MQIGSRPIEIVLPDARLSGDLELPSGASGIVLFAHGSGSSRLSPRNRKVALGLRQRGLGTLLLDLLTADEERVDLLTRVYRFDISLLAERLIGATNWIAANEPAATALGYFGASTGAAAALLAAATLPDTVRAVVSRGGRPDFAKDALSRVRAPTLLIVGGRDPDVLALNEAALRALDCEKALVVVPGATHLFEEPGTLDAVTRHAGDWLAQHLAPRL